MSFPKYPAYKDSGVEWLGEVPQSWKVRPIKSCGWLKGGAGFPHEHQGDGSFELDFHKVNALATASREGYLQPSENTVSRETARALGAYVFPSGTIVFAKVGAALLLRRLRRIASPACIDNNMMGLVVFEDAFHPDFMLYAMGTVRFDLISNPGAVPSLNESQIGNYRLAIPTIEEQTQIARFLDHETARIDALIEEQQRLIELLKEKRQAVISHAVTKGLDPTVPMKDSGVEWLGEVPAHWRVCKLSFRYAVELGKMLDEKKNTGTNPVPYLRNQDVQWGSINVDNLPLIDVGLHEYERYTVRFGDLLVCEGGDVGRAAIWRHKDKRVGYQKALHRLRPVYPHRDTAEFFFYSLMTAKTVGVFEESDTKATISHLPAEKFRQYRFAFPPIEEQLEIASVLEGKLTHSNEIILYAENMIFLLQERRSALISAAVTGKIDVRNWQPPAGQYPAGDTQNRTEPEVV